MPSQTRIEAAPDLEELAHRAARWITDLAGRSNGRFAICLSGGSTPRRLYQLLAAAPYREAMPWDRVHWFWGDERFVPWDHPDSNYRMAREALLAHVPAPTQNIHGIATTGDPAGAARDQKRRVPAAFERRIGQGDAHLRLGADHLGDPALAFLQDFRPRKQ